MVALILATIQWHQAPVKISVLVLFVFFRGLVYWCIGRSTSVSSWRFGGLSCSSSLYFAASWVQTMTRR